MTKSIPIKALCAEIIRLFEEQKTYDILTTAVHNVTGDKSIVLSVRDRRTLTELALVAQNGHEHPENAVYVFVPVDLTYEPTDAEHAKYCLHAKWFEFKTQFMDALLATDAEAISSEELLVMLYKAFMTGVMSENGLNMALAGERQFGNERLANIMESHNMEIIGQFLADCKAEMKLERLRKMLGALFPEDAVDPPHQAAHKYH